jgi:hypothetical protein
MLPEDLTEVERVKLLLGKKSDEQKAYFFTNVENIFELHKRQFHNVYGPEHSEPEARPKYNYETQRAFDKGFKFQRKFELMAKEDEAMKPVSSFLMQEKQTAIQKEVFPLVFDNFLGRQSEYLQILAGEAFLTLLKAEGFHFVPQFLDRLRAEAVLMLQLWSSDILEIWTEVYALAIARKTSTTGSMDLDECK